MGVRGVRGAMGVERVTCSELNVTMYMEILHMQ